MLVLSSWGHYCCWSTVLPAHLKHVANSTWNILIAKKKNLGETHTKVRKQGASGSSVGRAGAPHAEDMSSLQRPQVQFQPQSFVMCHSPSVSPPFPVHIFSCLSIQKGQKEEKRNTKQTRDPLHFVLTVAAPNLWQCVCVCVFVGVCVCVCVLFPRWCVGQCGKE